MIKKKNTNLLLKRYRAFTIVELMISMIIIALVGSVVVTALYVTFRISRQTEDYVSAAQEIQSTMLALRTQFANIGLGMPNNSAKMGSFNISFTGPNPEVSTANQPVMAFMGDFGRGNREWGGPVTLGISEARDNHTNQDFYIRDRNSSGVYAGEELFYAWAVPTRIRLARGSVWNQGVTKYSSRDPYDQITIELLNNGDVQRLREFSYEGRNIGIEQTDRGKNVRSWILFPSLRIPLLIEDSTDAINNTENTIKVGVSPLSSFSLNGVGLDMEGSLFGLEEVHLLQAASIFVDKDNRELIQRLYGRVDNTRDYIDKVLASNVLAVYFVFDDRLRILTMYTVACGNAPNQADPGNNRNYLSSMLPSFLDYNIVPTKNMGYRMLVENLSWRIRN